jgi:hypothetical protein
MSSKPLSPSPPRPRPASASSTLWNVVYALGVAVAAALIVAIIGLVFGAISFGNIDGDSGVTTGTYNPIRATVNRHGDITDAEVACTINNTCGALYATGLLAGNLAVDQVLNDNCTSTTCTAGVLLINQTSTEENYLFGQQENAIWTTVVQPSSVQTLDNSVTTLAVGLQSTPNNTVNWGYYAPATWVALNAVVQHFGTNSTSALYGCLSETVIGLNQNSAANTTSLVGYGSFQTMVGAGLVTQAFGYWAERPEIGTSQTVTLTAGFVVLNQGAPSVTTAAGVIVDLQQNAANNIGLWFRSTSTGSPNGITWSTSGSPGSPVSNLYYGGSGQEVKTDYSLSSLHLVGNSAAPANGCGSCAGSGTGPTITITGTDTTIHISITTGSSPTAAATIVIVNFATAFVTNAPVCTLVPAGANSWPLQAVSGSTVTVSATVSAVTVTAGSSVALSATTAYLWNVICVGVR